MPHQDNVGADMTTYIHDRSKVWQTMAEICRDDKCWTYVKPFQRSRGGRGAFQTLHAHYLGGNHVNNMVASIAEAKLAQAKYFGEKGRYNFESYITLLTTWSHSNPPISGTTVLLPSDVLARYM